MVGNIDESLVKSIAEDFTVALVKGTYQMLLEHKKDKIAKQKFQIKDFPFQNTPIKYPAVEELGKIYAFLIYREKYMREELKKVSKTKHIDWKEDCSYDFAVAKAGKFTGNTPLNFGKKASSEKTIG